MYSLCHSLSPYRKLRSLHMIRCGSSWAVGDTLWWSRVLRKAFIVYLPQTTHSSWSPPQLSLLHNATATSHRLAALLTPKHMGLAHQWVCMSKLCFNEAKLTFMLIVHLKCHFEKLQTNQHSCSIKIVKKWKPMIIIIIHMCCEIFQGILGLPLALSSVTDKHALLEWDQATDMATEEQRF